MTLPRRSGYRVERRDVNNNGAAHAGYEHSRERPAPQPQELYQQHNSYDNTRMMRAADVSSPPPSHTTRITSCSSSSSSSNKNKATTDLTPQAIQEKKAFVQNHRLHPHMLQIIEEFKREGIIPAIPIAQHVTEPDHSLAEFLESQGIESLDEEDDERTDEFSAKLRQFKSAFNEEINKLKDISNQYTAKMVALLREQSQIRHVSQEEVQAKIQIIQNKFDYVKNQLRTNVCNAILVLQKQYNHQSAKRRRSLSKKATHALNEWFFSHINDPYPSEEEKSTLATQCVLSLNQVNNWFGNKRIRYKRKCLEGEARRSELQQQAPLSMQAGLAVGCASPHTPLTPQQHECM